MTRPSACLRSFSQLRVGGSAFVLAGIVPAEGASSVNFWVAAPGSSVVGSGSSPADLSSFHAAAIIVQLNVSGLTGGQRAGRLCISRGGERTACAPLLAESCDGVAQGGGRLNVSLSAHARRPSGLRDSHFRIGLTAVLPGHSCQLVPVWPTAAGMGDSSSVFEAVRDSVTPWTATAGQGASMQGGNTISCLADDGGPAIAGRSMPPRLVLANIPPAADTSAFRKSLLVTLFGAPSLVQRASVLLEPDFGPAQTVLLAQRPDGAGEGAATWDAATGSVSATLLVGDIEVAVVSSPIALGLGQDLGGVRICDAADRCSAEGGLSEHVATVSLSRGAGLSASLQSLERRAGLARVRLLAPVQLATVGTMHLICNSAALDPAFDGNASCVLLHDSSGWSAANASRVAGYLPSEPRAVADNPIVLLDSAPSVADTQHLVIAVAGAFGHGAVVAGNVSVMSHRGQAAVASWAVGAAGAHADGQLPKLTVTFSPQPPPFVSAAGYLRLSLNPCNSSSKVLVLLPSGASRFEASAESLLAPAVACVLGADGAPFGTNLTIPATPVSAARFSWLGQPGAASSVGWLVDGSLSLGQSLTAASSATLVASLVSEGSGAPIAGPAGAIVALIRYVGLGASTSSAVRLGTVEYARASESVSLPMAFDEHSASWVATWVPSISGRASLTLFRLASGVAEQVWPMHRGAALNVTVKANVTLPATMVDISATATRALDSVGNVVQLQPTTVLRCSLQQPVSSSVQVVRAEADPVQWLSDAQRELLESSSRGCALSWTSAATGDLRIAGSQSTNWTVQTTLHRVHQRDPLTRIGSALVRTLSVEALAPAFSDIDWHRRFTNSSSRAGAASAVAPMTSLVLDAKLLPGDDRDVITEAESASLDLLSILSAATNALAWLSRLCGTSGISATYSWNGDDACNTMVASSSPSNGTLGLALNAQISVGSNVTGEAVTLGGRFQVRMCQAALFAIPRPLEGTVVVVTTEHASRTSCDDISVRGLGDGAGYLAGVRKNGEVLAVDHAAQEASALYLGWPVNATVAWGVPGAANAFARMAPTPSTRPTVNLTLPVPSSWLVAAEPFATLTWAGSERQAYSRIQPGAGAAAWLAGNANPLAGGSGLLPAWHIEAETRGSQIARVAWTPSSSDLLEVKAEWSSGPTPARRCQLSRNGSTTLLRCADTASPLLDAEACELAAMRNVSVSWRVAGSLQGAVVAAGAGRSPACQRSTAGRELVIHPEAIGIFAEACLGRTAAAFGGAAAAAWSITAQDPSPGLSAAPKACSIGSPGDGNASQVGVAQAHVPYASIADLVLGSSQASWSTSLRVMAVGPSGGVDDSAPLSGVPLAQASITCVVRHRIGVQQPVWLQATRLPGSGRLPHLESLECRSASKRWFVSLRPDSIVRRGITTTFPLTADTKCRLGFDSCFGQFLTGAHIYAASPEADCSADKVGTTACVVGLQPTALYEKNLLVQPISVIVAEGTRAFVSVAPAQPSSESFSDHAYEVETHGASRRGSGRFEVSFSLQQTAPNARRTRLLDEAWLGALGGFPRGGVVVETEAADTLQLPPTVAAIGGASLRLAAWQGAFLPLDDSQHEADLPSLAGVDTGVLDSPINSWPTRRSLVVVQTPSYATSGAGSLRARVVPDLHGSGTGSAGASLPGSLIPVDSAGPTSWSALTPGSVNVTLRTLVRFPVVTMLAAPPAFSATPISLAAANSFLRLARIVVRDSSGKYSRPALALASGSAQAVSASRLQVRRAAGTFIAAASVMGQPLAAALSSITVVPSATIHARDMQLLSPLKSGFTAFSASYNAQGSAVPDKTLVVANLGVDTAVSAAAAVFDDLLACGGVSGFFGAPSVPSDATLGSFAIPVWAITSATSSPVVVSTFFIARDAEGGDNACNTAPHVIEGPSLSFVVTYISMDPARSDVVVPSGLRRHGDNLTITLWVRDGQGNLATLPSNDLASHIVIECADPRFDIFGAVAACAPMWDGASVLDNGSVQVPVMLNAAGNFSVYVHVLGDTISAGVIALEVLPPLLTAAASFVTDYSPPNGSATRLADALPSGAILIVGQTSRLKFMAFNATLPWRWPETAAFRGSSSSSSCTVEVSAAASPEGEADANVTCLDHGHASLTFEVQMESGRPWESVDTWNVSVAQGWPSSLKSTIAAPAAIIGGMCRAAELTLRDRESGNIYSALPAWLLQLADAQLESWWCPAPEFNATGCVSASMQSTASAWTMGAGTSSGSFSLPVCAFGADLPRPQAWLRLHISSRSMPGLLPAVELVANASTWLRSHPLPFPPATQSIWTAASAAKARVSCPLQPLGPAGAGLGPPCVSLGVPSSMAGTVVAAAVLRDRMGLPLEALAVQSIEASGQLAASAVVGSGGEPQSLPVVLCNSSTAVRWAGADEACSGSSNNSTILVVWPLGLGSAEAVVSLTVLRRLVPLQSDGSPWARIAVLGVASTLHSVLVPNTTTATATPGSAWPVVVLFRDAVGRPSCLPGAASGNRRLRAVFYARQRGNSGTASECLLACDAEAGSTAGSGYRCSCSLALPETPGAYEIRNATVLAHDAPLLRLQVSVESGAETMPGTVTSSVLVAHRSSGTNSSSLRLKGVTISSGAAPAGTTWCGSLPLAVHAPRDSLRVTLAPEHAGGAGVSAWSPPALRQRAIMAAELLTADGPGCAAAQQAKVNTSCAWQQSGSLIECSVPLLVCSGLTPTVRLSTGLGVGSDRDILDACVLPVTLVPHGLQSPAPELSALTLSSPPHSAGVLWSSDRVVVVEAGVVISHVAHADVRDALGLPLSATPSVDTAVVRDRAVCPWCAQSPAVAVFPGAASGGTVNISAHFPTPAAVRVSVGTISTEAGARLRLLPLAGRLDGVTNFTIIAALPVCSWSNTSVVGTLALVGAQLLAGGSAQLAVAPSFKTPGIPSAAALGCRLGDRDGDWLRRATIRSAVLQAATCTGGCFVNISAASSPAPANATRSAWTVDLATSPWSRSASLGARTGSVLRLWLELGSGAIVHVPLQGTLVLPPSLEESLAHTYVVGGPPGVNRTFMVAVPLFDGGGRRVICGGETAIGAVTNLTVNGTRAVACSGAGHGTCAGPATLARCHGNSSALVEAAGAGSTVLIPVRLDSTGSAELGMSAGSVLAQAVLPWVGQAFDGAGRLLGASVSRSAYPTAVAGSAGELLHVRFACAAQPWEASYFWEQAAARAEQWVCLAEQAGQLAPLPVSQVARSNGSDCLSVRLFATAPTVSGVYNVSCKLAGVSLAGSVSMTVVAGEPSASLSTVSRPGRPWHQLDEDAAIFELTARDQFGNAADVPNATADVRAWAVSPSGLRLPLPFAFARTSLSRGTMTVTSEDLPTNSSEIEVQWPQGSNAARFPVLSGHAVELDLHMAKSSNRTITIAGNRVSFRVSGTGPQSRPVGPLPCSSLRVHVGETEAFPTCVGDASGVTLAIELRAAGELNLRVEHSSGNGTLPVVGRTSVSVRPGPVSPSNSRCRVATTARSHVHGVASWKDGFGNSLTQAEAPHWVVAFLVPANLSSQEHHGLLEVVRGFSAGEAAAAAALPEWLPQRAASVACAAFVEPAGSRLQLVPIEGEQSAVLALDPSTDLPLPPAMLSREDGLESTTAAEFDQGLAPAAQALILPWAQTSTAGLSVTRVRGSRGWVSDEGSHAGTWGVVRGGRASQAFTGRFPESIAVGRSGTISVSALDAAGHPARELCWSVLAESSGQGRLVPLGELESGVCGFAVSPEVSGNFTVTLTSRSTNDHVAKGTTRVGVGVEASRQLVVFNASTGQWGATDASLVSAVGGIGEWASGVLGVASFDISGIRLPCLAGAGPVVRVADGTAVLVPLGCSDGILAVGVQAFTSKVCVASTSAVGVTALRCLSPGSGRSIRTTSDSRAGELSNWLVTSSALAGDTWRLRPSGGSPSAWGACPPESPVRCGEVCRPSSADCDPSSPTEALTGCPLGSMACGGGRGCAPDLSWCGNPPAESNIAASESCGLSETRCADGSCHASMTACPMGVVSSPGSRPSLRPPMWGRCQLAATPVLCAVTADGTSACASVPAECGPSQSVAGKCVGGGQWLRCANGTCSGTPGSCRNTSSSSWPGSQALLAGRCPTWAPTRCPVDGRCIAFNESCHMRPMGAAGRFRCSDGTFAELPGACPHHMTGCPRSAPVRLDNGTCARPGRSVTMLRCPRVRAVLCPDGSCSASSSCPSGSIWHQSLAGAATECPASRPVRCQAVPGVFVCAEHASECEGVVLSTPGIPWLADSICKPWRPLPCGDGSCGRSSAECAARLAQGALPVIPVSEHVAWITCPDDAPFVGGSSDRRGGSLASVASATGLPIDDLGAVHDSISCFKSLDAAVCATGRLCADGSCSPACSAAAEAGPELQHSFMWMLTSGTVLAVNQSLWLGAGQPEVTAATGGVRSYLIGRRSSLAWRPGSIQWIATGRGRANTGVIVEPGPGGVLVEAVWRPDASGQPGTHVNVSEAASLVFDLGLLSSARTSWPSSGEESSRCARVLVPGLACEDRVEATAAGLRRVPGVHNATCGAVYDLGLADSWETEAAWTGAAALSTHGSDPVLAVSVPRGAAVSLTGCDTLPLPSTSPTPTSAATITPSPSASATPSSSATPSTSATPTASITTSPSSSPSPSSSSSVSSSPLPSSLPSPSSSDSPSESPTPTASETPSATAPPASPSQELPKPTPASSPDSAPPPAANVSSRPSTTGQPPGAIGGSDDKTTSLDDGKPIDPAIWVAIAAVAAALLAAAILCCIRRTDASRRDVIRDQVAGLAASNRFSPPAAARPRLRIDNLGGAGIPRGDSRTEARGDSRHVGGESPLASEATMQTSGVLGIGLASTSCRSPTPHDGRSIQQPSPVVRKASWSKPQPQVSVEEASASRAAFYEALGSTTPPQHGQARRMSRHRVGFGRPEHVRKDPGVTAAALLVRSRVAASGLHNQQL